MYPVRFRPSKTVSLVSLRGPLTWDLLSRPDVLTLGDPGILARALVAKSSIRVERDWPSGTDFALVPHFSEADYYLSRYPNLSIIDPRQHPLEVCAQIQQVGQVFSSSLHGIVVADSFGIPSVWLERLNGSHGHHKFIDYFLSVGRSKRLRPHMFTSALSKLSNFSLKGAHFSESDILSALDFAVKSFLRDAEL